MLNMWSAVGTVVRANSNTTATGSMYIKFVLAIERQKQKDEEKAKTDYINCAIFGKNCAYFNSYIEIGDTICVYGPMQSSQYEKNGKKVYVTECYVLQYSLVKKSGVGVPQANNMPIQAPPNPPPVYQQTTSYQLQSPQCVTTAQQPVQHCPPAPQPQTWPEPPPENLPFDIYGM